MIDSTWVVATLAPMVLSPGSSQTVPFEFHAHDEVRLTVAATAPKANAEVRGTFELRDLTGHTVLLFPLDGSAARETTFVMVIGGPGSVTVANATRGAALTVNAGFRIRNVLVPAERARDSLRVLADSLRAVAFNANTAASTWRATALFALIITGWISWAWRRKVRGR